VAESKIPLRATARISSGCSLDDLSKCTYLGVTITNAGPLPGGNVRAYRRRFVKSEVSRWSPILKAASAEGK
jgi:hypothetical protein